MNSRRNFLKVAAGIPLLSIFPNAQESRSSILIPWKALETFSKRIPAEVVGTCIKKWAGHYRSVPGIHNARYLVFVVKGDSWVSAECLGELDGCPTSKGSKYAADEEIWVAEFDKSNHGFHYELLS